jgi:hypothetical protein
MKPEVYKDEGYKLMGAAFEVYNERGYGLAEEIYQESLEIELEPVGYLVNFGHKDTLEWKRLILSEFIPLQKSAPISADWRSLPSLR